MKRTIVAAVCSLAFSFGSSAQRLPDNVLPESYDLKFEPNLASATFSGDETIRVRLQRPASSFVLNSAEIEFKEVTVTAAGSRQTATVC
jgi:aminopeptidase N/puromycin-sensitive aminopeptidase